LPPDIGRKVVGIRTVTAIAQKITGLVGISFRVDDLDWSPLAGARFDRSRFRLVAGASLAGCVDDLDWSPGVRLVTALVRVLWR
jgi:hypothetical protein